MEAPEGGLWHPSLRILRTPAGWHARQRRVPAGGQGGAGRCLVSGCCMPPSRGPGRQCTPAVQASRHTQTPARALTGPAAARLPPLQQPGMSRLTKAQSQADVRTAAQRYITFDWSRLHQLGLIMVCRRPWLAAGCLLAGSAAGTMLGWLAWLAAWLQASANFPLLLPPASTSWYLDTHPTRLQSPAGTACTAGTAGEQHAGAQRGGGGARPRPAPGLRRAELPDHRQQAGLQERCILL